MSTMALHVWHSQLWENFCSYELLAWVCIAKRQWWSYPVFIFVLLKAARSCYHIVSLQSWAKENIYLAIHLGKFRELSTYSVSFSCLWTFFFPKWQEILVVQKYKKHKIKQVYTSNQWYEVMKSAMKRSPFDVVEMTKIKWKALGSTHLAISRRPLKMGINLSIHRMLKFCSSVHPAELLVRRSLR